MFLPAREGTLQVEMLSGARRQGALAVRLPGTLEALLREAVDGRPPVVLLNLGLSIAPRWHYAVLVGHDLDEREVILRSGTTERAAMIPQTISLDGAQADWFRAAEFYEQEFAVTPSSNRMGLRLEGRPLQIPQRELVSEPVCPGAVQVTRDGQWRSRASSSAMCAAHAARPSARWHVRKRPRRAGSMRRRPRWPR